jgi:hypothetical protein
VNSLRMKLIFSTPMPCSPVTLPPQAMHFVENLVAGRQHALDLIGVALVEEQDRMDVAVAGVKDVGDADAYFAADRDDPPQNVRQLVRGTTPSCVQ